MAKKQKHVTVLSIFDETHLLQLPIPAYFVETEGGDDKKINLLENQHLLAQIADNSAFIYSVGEGECVLVLTISPQLTFTSAAILLYLPLQDVEEGFLPTLFPCHLTAEQHEAICAFLLNDGLSDLPLLYSHGENTQEAEDNEA